MSLPAFSGLQVHEVPWVRWAHLVAAAGRAKAVEEIWGLHLLIWYLRAQVPHSSFVVLGPCHARGRPSWSSSPGLSLLQP